MLSEGPGRRGWGKAQNGEVRASVKVSWMILGPTGPGRTLGKTLLHSSLQGH